MLRRLSRQMTGANKVSKTWINDNDFRQIQRHILTEKKTMLNLKLK